jgi:hypothetical protein
VNKVIPGGDDIKDSDDDEADDDDEVIDDFIDRPFDCSIEIIKSKQHALSHK